MMDIAKLGELLDRIKTASVAEATYRAFLEWAQVAMAAQPALLARLEAADQLAEASREFNAALDAYKRHCATETDTPEMVEAIDYADAKLRTALTTYDLESAK